jgi:hypothetical protein
VLPFPSSLPCLATPATEAAEGRALMSFGMRQWRRSMVYWASMVHSPWTESTDFPIQKLFKKIQFSDFLGKFVEKPLELQTFITFQPKLQIQVILVPKFSESRPLSH